MFGWVPPNALLGLIEDPELMNLWYFRGNILEERMQVVNDLRCPRPEIISKKKLHKAFFDILECAKCTSEFTDKKMKLR